MKLQGVNRVIVAVEDLEKGIDFYSKLLGATFDDASWTGEPFGLSVVIAWDAGIELCAPRPGQDSVIKQFIDQRGEGLMGVVFGVDDADEAREIAEKAGVGAVFTIDYTPDEIRQHLRGRFKRYKEYVLDSNQACGFGIMLGQIEPK